MGGALPRGYAPLPPMLKINEMKMQPKNVS